MDDEIVERLDKEGKKRGLPPHLLEFYGNLFRIQADMEKFMGNPEHRLNKTAARARMEQGLPLLHLDELVLDWSLLQYSLLQVITTFGNYPDLFGELPESLKEIKSQPSLGIETVKAWLKRSEMPATITTNDVKEYRLFEAVIQEALRPFLAAKAKVLQGLVEQNYWQRNYCPICGGKPDFAFLDRERGARWLLCSRCDSEWLFQRLRCPYCESREQNDLAYFSDTMAIYRLYVCENCRTYIKAIDLRQMKYATWLPLERILTLNMDRQALENGYRAGHLEALN